MANDSFDDGLVHNHDWARVSTPPRADAFPIADVRYARTPSTVYHDEQIEIG